MVYELNAEFENCSSACLTLRDGAFLRYENGLLTLHLEKGGFGRDRRSVRLERLKKLRIFPTPLPWKSSSMVGRRSLPPGYTGRPVP